MSSPSASPSPDRPSEDLYDHDDSDNICFLCRQPDYRLVYEIERYGFPFRFMRCQCGLIKQTPMPSLRFFDWFFNSELFLSSKQTGKSEIWGFYDYLKDEPCRLATSERRYRKLEPFLVGRQGLDILKIGPATGSFLFVANRHDHHAIGCDVSEKFIDFARQKYDVQIDHGRFEHFGYPDQSFDVVLLFNVIENIPNQVEFLSAVRRVLKPGGLFILNFVDERRNLVEAFQRERYFLYRPPICYIFGFPVMERLLRSFDFEMISWFRDVRYLHAEKIATLLGWRWLLSLARRLGVHRRPFPIYAYPSRIVVARRR